MTIVHDLAISSHKAAAIIDALKQKKFQVHLQEITGGIHLEVEPHGLSEHDARASVRAAIIQATKTI